MAINRVSIWVASLVASVALFLSGCSAIGEWLGEDAGAPVGPAIGAVTDIALASGNPLWLGLVGIANAVFAIWAGKRAVRKEDAKPWSDDDVATLVDALRAKGYRVDKPTA